VGAPELLRAYLAGCGSEKQLAELYGIARQMAEALALGELSEEELRTYCYKLCAGVQSLASRCGRAVSIDECAEKLAEEVRKDAAAMYARSVMEELRKRRSRTGGPGTARGFSVI